MRQEKELAQDAKNFVIDMPHGAEVVELQNMQRSKYFRIVADVVVDGQNLTDLLIAAGLGVAYDGRRKTHNWCAVTR